MFEIRVFGVDAKAFPFLVKYPISGKYGGLVHSLVARCDHPGKDFELDILGIPG